MWPTGEACVRIIYVAVEVDKEQKLTPELSCARLVVSLINKRGVYSVCVCVCVVIPFNLNVRLEDVPAGVTQEEGHTGFLTHLPSAVLALIFLARRIQPFLSLVDREVEFCVLTN